MDPAGGVGNGIDRIGLGADAGPDGTTGCRRDYAVPTGSRILVCGVPTRAGAASAEAPILVRRNLRKLSASCAVVKSRSITT